MERFADPDVVETAREFDDALVGSLSRGAGQTEEQH